MFKLSIISFVWLIGEVWSISLIRQLNKQGEFGEAANNTLNDSEHSNDTTNPEELGTYFEGDILLPKQALMFRNGVTSQVSRWPNGVVPYEIRGRFNAREIDLIKYVFNEFHQYSCIRFVPRTTQLDYISIINSNPGCYSYAGRIGGKQDVNLESPLCLKEPGTVLHELMHALGFHHEQNRKDRDEFVYIQYRNILPSAMYNFNKEVNTDAFGVPYDYRSIMHYSATAFSINGQPTIIPKKYVRTRLGQRSSLSAGDVEKVNKMYKC